MFYLNLFGFLSVCNLSISLQSSFSSHIGFFIVFHTHHIAHTRGQADGTTVHSPHTDSLTHTHTHSLTAGVEREISDSSRELLRWSEEALSDSKRYASRD